MRKMDLISAICEQTGLSRYVVKTVVDAAFAQIAETSKSGEAVVLPGFGRFQEVLGKDGQRRLRFFPAKPRIRRSDGIAARVLPLTGTSG